MNHSVGSSSTFISRVCRFGLAFVWLYHGLVPKILVRHPDEFRPLWDAGFGQEAALRMVLLAGVAEITLGALHLAGWKLRRLYQVNIALMLVALVGVAVTTPALLVGAFNPVSLNLLVIALSAIGLKIQ